jgi:hypothetical protein
MNLRRKIIDIRHEVRCAYQRVVRGWDVTAIWNTDGWLTKLLGEVLVASSKELHGYPDEMDPELWKDSYRMAGEALLTYADNDWLSMSDEEYQAITEKAQEALHWVANNLPHLWD